MNNIIKDWLEYKTLLNSIQEKKNQILDCIPLIEKSLEGDKERISSKQKKIAFDLSKDFKRRNALKKNLIEEIKSFTTNSLSDFLTLGIKKKDIKNVRECLKYFKK